MGTYSAAPYRMNFRDFHPETALGFLPHELDFTHLRMLWRRWKKKAGLSVFGRSITPLGPLWLDRTISFAFNLRGDCLPDFRLIDYLVSLLSTDQSPALNGMPGNDLRLKRDLGQLGVFDERMSLCLLYKLRAQSVMGFSGFEGRHYSLFWNHLDDFADAAGLQALVTALAFRYIATGLVNHEDIPDDPLTESERRQCLFASAIGVGTVNVREAGPNRLLTRILGKTQKTRASRRYAGHLRVRCDDYRFALVATLEEDAAELIEAFQLKDCLGHLRERLLDSEQRSTAGKLTQGISEFRRGRQSVRSIGRRVCPGGRRILPQAVAPPVCSRSVRMCPGGSTGDRSGRIRERPAVSRACDGHDRFTFSRWRLCAGSAGLVARDGRCRDPPSLPGPLFRGHRPRRGHVASYRGSVTRLMISPHQYIERETDSVRTERFCGDRWLNWAYRA